MDFKDIINKVAELNDEVEYVKAPELEKAPQLNEDQELRMLAGLKPLTESAVAEIVEETEEVLSEMDNMQTGEKKKSATGGTIEKTATGYKHHGKKYGGSADDEEDKDDDMDEAVEAEEEVVDEASEAQKKAREKFMAMVKSKKEKKEESVKESSKTDDDAEAKKKKEEKKKKIAKIMDEGSKPDFLDMDKDGDKKEPMKKALKDKKDKKTDEGACKSKKKMKEEIKESADDVLSFREMAKLVKESGGQQRIDATDTALWTWAKRVAGNKFEDKTRQEVYAGLVYERMGGHFDMVDVLAENND